MSLVFGIFHTSYISEKSSSVLSPIVLLGWIWLYQNKNSMLFKSYHNVKSHKSTGSKINVATLSRSLIMLWAILTMKTSRYLGYYLTWLPILLAQQVYNPKATS